MAKRCCTHKGSENKILSGKGIPICPAGLEMRYHHRDGQRRRQYYHCPVKRKTRIHGKLGFVAEPERCPLGVLCQPESQMGSVVYVAESENQRLHPVIRRDSPKYRRLMNLRSGCERSNAVKKTTYGIERFGFRRSSRSLIVLYFIALLEHASAWLSEDKKHTDKREKELFWECLKPT